MSTGLGKIKRTFICTSVLSAVMLITAGCSFASDVNLSEIEISSSDNGYNVILKTDKKAEFKQTLKNNKQLLIDMKNTTATEDFSTSYNSVYGINNVTVTPEKDSLKIEIQGEHIVNTAVNVEAKTAPIAPVREYKANTGKTINWANYSPSLLLSKIKNYRSQNNSKFNWISILGFGLIILSASKAFAKKEKTTQTTNGLHREKGLAQKMHTETRETLSLRSKISKNNSAPSINYEAKKSHLHELTARPARPSRKTTIKTTPTTSPIRSSQVHIDSIKFLESMSQIYENSGREDLAVNLKKIITK